MRSRRRQSQNQATVEARNPGNALGVEVGNFTLGGSWDPEAERPLGKDKLYGLVFGLCRLRRNRPDLLPCDFVEPLSFSGFKHAFPTALDTDPVKRMGWVFKRNWLEAYASTAAERTIKTACNLEVPNPVGEHPDTPEVRDYLGKYFPDLARIVSSWELVP